MNKKSKYVLAMDQGTTSSRAIVFDDRANISAIARREFKQLFPKPGWVEHDPVEILDTQIATAVEALDLAGITRADISAVGITNQRETCVVWDRSTGQPVANAIVWQDRRTSDLCYRIRNEHADFIRRKTGLEVDPYFSASKLKWILENIVGAAEAARAGDLLFGTVDSWLIWNLTGKECHVTDVSNASRTMLYDIERLRWDEELLDIFNIPSGMMPEVRSSSGFIGEIKIAGPLNGVEIHGIAGDQQAALFGQLCTGKGSTKNTYGTGCFMLMNTGDAPAPSKNRLLTTIAWQIGEKCSYALEGSVFTGGAVVQWLRDSLQIISDAGEIEELASSVQSSDGVFFVPALTGLGTPYWDPYARGLIIGISRGTGRAHIARAALESIAFQSAELLSAMKKDAGSSVDVLKVDGGASANDMLLQFQADILQVPVVRSKVVETTALGAAYLAGLSSGVWKNKEELRDHWREDRRFEPSIAQSESDAMISRWKEAVERSLGWEKAN